MHTIRWTYEKIHQRLNLILPLQYRRSVSLPPFKFLQHASAAERGIVAPDADDSDWTIIEPKTVWGGKDINYTLRTNFQFLDDWDSSIPTTLYLPLGDNGDFSHPENLVYIDGVSIASCDRHHQEVLLPTTYLDGKLHVIALHGWTGMTSFEDKDIRPLVMPLCKLVQIDPPCRDFIALARVALETTKVLEDNHPAKGHLLNALDTAFGLLDICEPLTDSFYKSIAAAHKGLKDGIELAGASLDVEVVAVGHAHIDIAWLWTLQQTRHKAQRTFHNVLDLMDRYPNFHYTQSQPQLYEYVRQDNPVLFERIRQRIDEGRWEATGGMWVEADCNLSGAESLARQFLLGRQFYREHFGNVDTPVMWLPDVFGFSWSLPQLIKLAEMDYFFTIKIGWNQYNRFPYDSFWWQGIDGTPILTHFSTTPRRFESDYRATYNATATPDEILETWRNFPQKEQQQILMMSYGHGDGGGGPTYDMIDNIILLQDFPGIPQTRSGRAADFFKQMESQSGDGLPKWNGELYLEYHRGTYTTHARNKRANRKSEFLLHDAEFLATYATIIAGDYDYPHDDLRKAWRFVCLNQFHDIIPGSSIGAVYEDSLKQYKQVEEIGNDIIQSALQHISQCMDGASLLINPTSFERSDLIFWEGQVPKDHCLVNESGSPITVQPAEAGMWIFISKLAPYSISRLFLKPLVAFEPLKTELDVSKTHLENSFIRVELNAGGDITRIFDKRSEREVLAPETIGNQFQAFEDRPMNWDAWDIDIFYDDKMWLADAAISITITETGPLRATLCIKRQILNSVVIQHISLAHNSAQIDFHTQVDWRERRILLKVAFPVNILSPTATYEIQWGHVERPTHQNTSWDWARFETCAQKWVDLSEGDYGVSLLNDSKYGHDIHDNIMRLSLLRGTTFPDPNADSGTHEFTYSLLPHCGQLGHETICAAYALNNPMRVWDRPTSTSILPDKADSGSLISTDDESVIIETVKLAEDGVGIIVRLYEAQRTRGTVIFHTNFPIADAKKVNLLETTMNDVTFTEQTVSIAIRPFEIVTLRIVPQWRPSKTRG